jgi:hypothetical protein
MFIAFNLVRKSSNDTAESVNLGWVFMTILTSALVVEWEVKFPFQRRLA